MRRALFAPARFLLRRRRIPPGVAGALIIAAGGFAALALGLLFFT